MCVCVCVCVCILCEIYAWVSIVCNSVVLCGCVGKWVSSCVCVCMCVCARPIINYVSTRPTTNTLTNYGIFKIIIDRLRQRPLGLTQVPPLSKSSSSNCKHRQSGICIYLYVYIYIYIYTYIYVYAYTYTHTHIYIHRVNPIK